MKGRPELLGRLARVEETVAMCVRCLSALAFDPKARSYDAALLPAARADADLDLARRRDAAIAEAIRRTGGVQVEAAKLLGISQRQLCYWLVYRPRRLARGTRRKAGVA